MVSAPKRPQIPQSVSFYFIFVIYVFSIFTTPFTIGQSYWGAAYGEMDNSTNTSTNSTDITSPEYIPANLTHTAESAVSSLQNATLTETDNVADSIGPKLYTVSLSEGLKIGDGSSNEAQDSDEPTVLQTPVPSANSTNTQISESISFNDHTSVENPIITEEIINLDEQIGFLDIIDGLIGTASVKISEQITFTTDNDTMLHTPLRVTVEIQEDLPIGVQVAIDGAAEISVSEHLQLSEEIAIYTPIIRILESIEFSESLQSNLIVIPLEDIPYVGLLPQNSTLILNGTAT